jgi:hypothetical protein
MPTHESPRAEPARRLTHAERLELVLLLEERGWLTPAEAQERRVGLRSGSAS